MSLFSPCFCVWYRKCVNWKTEPIPKETYVNPCCSHSFTSCSFAASPSSLSSIYWHIFDNRGGFWIFTESLGVGKSVQAAGRWWKDHFPYVDVLHIVNSQILLIYKNKSIIISAYYVALWMCLGCCIATLTSAYGCHLLISMVLCRSACVTHIPCKCQQHTPIKPLWQCSYISVTGNLTQHSKHTAI